MTVFTAIFAAWISRVIWRNICRLTGVYMTSVTEFDYLYGWIKNGHIRKNLTKNDYTQRCSWEGRGGEEFDVINVNICSTGRILTLNLGCRLHDEINTDILSMDNVKLLQ